MAEKTLRISTELALPLDVVTEATAIVATRGAGKSSASAVIVEEGFAAAVQTVVLDRTGVYWGLRSGSDGTNRGGLPIYVLGGPHGDVPLESHAGTLIADLVVDSDHSFVLDFSDFSKSAAIKFAADFLERLYDRKARARTTTLVVMDEAHFYAPQTPRGGFKGDAARLMGAMEDVVGLGRSRGLGVVLTTQRTQALNKAVLDLIETLFVMRMLSPRARDAVQDWIREKHEDDREGVIATLESLPTGTAWVWSPLRGILEKVAVRRIKTFDSYDTPKPGQKRVEPKERTELNLEALGEQMQATAERAKANDPAELRKRVRELERRLEARVPVTQAEPERVEVPVEVRVEVPVLDYEKFLQLQDAIKLEPLSELLEQLGNVRQAIYDGLEHARVLARHAADTKPAPAVPARHSNTSQRQPRAATGNPTEARPPVAAERSPQPGPRAATDNGASGGGGTTEPEQRILDALAWYEALGIRAPSKIAVGFLSGYRVNKKLGGNYGKSLGRLRAEGLIDYPGAGAVSLTDEGHSLARDPGIDHTNEAFRQTIFARLEPAEVRILEHLIEAYPEPIDKVELGQLSGYRVDAKLGGNYGKSLSKLRTFGLIDYPARGVAVALPVLFPEDA